MTSPHLGLGLAPPPLPSADPSPAPPPRRAPRLAKRRHAGTTSRSRAQPSTSASWNPFGAGGTDTLRQDGTSGSGSVDGDDASGFGKGQNDGFVFGRASTVRQQSPQPPQASSSEAPFVFGSVRDSLPRFDEGWSAASKLGDNMGKLNLQNPGKFSVVVGKGVDKKDNSSVFGVTIPSLAESEARVLPEMLTQLNIGTRAALHNESSSGVPKTFVFRSNGAGIFTDSRSTASSCSDSHGSSSVQVTEANGTPESGHADGTYNVAPGGVNTNESSADRGTDDASVLQEKITQLNIGNAAFQHMKDGGRGTHQPEMFGFGGGGTAGTIFGHVSSNTSDKRDAFFSSANTSSSIGDANLPPERTSTLNIGVGFTESMRSDNANRPPEAFVFGRKGSTNSASEHSAHGISESTLPEKMKNLNIQHRIPSQSMKDEAATRQPEPFVFGSNATSSSFVKTTSFFTSFQTSVSSETKDSARNLANDDTGDATYSKSSNDKGYVTSNFVIGTSSSAPARSEGAAEHALQDEIKKLNINREEPSAGGAKVNDSFVPAFSFQSKAEGTPGYGTVPEPKFQESFLFTPVNHSSSFSTANEMPSFSSNLMNAERGSAPGESNAVKHNQASCSRESLFGIDYIKSAYRDKTEAHKSTRKKKRPTRLKQHSQLHQVSQETGTIGLNSDLAGDCSPMDCSPYQAAVEQVSREASVGCDQSIHIPDSSVSNQNTSCAEDELVSATEHLVIDADLPKYHDEGRDPIADISESNFRSNFSEEINFCDLSQPLFTNMSVDANGEPKVYTTEASVDGFECNISGQTCEENTSRTQHESLGPVNTQPSSENLSGLNFTFGALLYPESSFSTPRHTTKRKLRTKGSQVPKPSATRASVQPKSSQDTKSMQFSPETSETENSVKEHLRRDASVLADLETCETWRTSGNQAYANGHFATAEGCYTRGINSISQYGTSGRCSRALMLCYSNRAATRMSLGRMREALEDCSTATSIDPTFLKAKVRFANCQLALGDLEGASSNYTACLKSSNTDIKMSAEASNGLERVKRVADWISQSRELLKKRTLPEAKTALEFISSALDISSHSDNLMEMKAEALLTLRRYEEVIELCQETVDLAERNAVLINASGEPNNSSVSGKAECSVTLWRQYLICKSYFLLGKLEEALDLLKRHELVAPVKESDGTTSRKCFSSLSTSIRQLLSFKAAGNESFQARRYSEAVEQYSAALACNSDSRPFSAVCFCNRAAAYQALGQLTDAIADCSLAMVLDANYPKAISRRATLYEMIRDYGQSANDLRKLISLIQKQANKPGVSPKVVNKHSDLKQARARLLSVEDEARKDTPLNLYLILGVEPSCSPPDIKKAYRKAALRHHPDKATQLLVRNENADDGFWRDIAKEVYSDADHLFKTIGEAYNILSDPDKREEYDIEENLRNAARRAFKGRSTQQTPEQHYRKQYDRGFSPRQWQSAGQSSKGAPRSRWSGYEYSDDYW